MTHSTPRAHQAAFLVTALCWTIVVFDGYDLIVYGTVLPQLLQEPGWNLTKSGAGLLGSLAFAGMLLGAVLAGTIADRLGRRKTIIACTAWFSIFTALCAFAPNPETFGVLRLLAGLGLGGLVPSANALAAEYVGPRQRSVVSTLMMSGVPIGGTLAALIGIFVLPRFGWEAMFLLALLALLVVIPVCLRFLPESPVWLRAQGRADAAAQLEARFGLQPHAEAHHPAPARGRLRTLVRPPFRGATMVFSFATVATLFAWYGLATWLPQLMRESGFDLGSALTFLVALNLGAVAGSLVTAWGGTRIGPVRTGVLAAGGAAVGIGVLLVHPASFVAYAALVLAGVGTHGTQCLIIASVANYYPSTLRGSALGFTLGFGRFGAVLAPQVGGWLLAAGLGVSSNFLAFALAAAVAGALLLTFAGRPAAPSHPRPVEATIPAKTLETEGASA
jgi:AAHS family benzoate transporter-like MFS transporter